MLKNMAIYSFLTKVSLGIELLVISDEVLNIKKSCKLSVEHAVHSYMKDVHGIGNGHAFS